MRKFCKYASCIFWTSIILLIVACGKNQEDISGNSITDIETINEKNNETSEIKLTQEYVCSEFGIDESEFESVDFEDFVAYYDLSYDTIHVETVACLQRVDM